jgi:hypothetical protein
VHVDIDPILDFPQRILTEIDQLFAHLGISAVSLLAVAIIIAVVWEVAR